MSLRFSLLVLILLALVAPARAAKTLKFCGLTWTVKSGEKMGPGPNAWSADNVWLDPLGQLHLRILPPARPGAPWQCAEIYTEQRFGFGRYQWQIVGRPDQFDPQIVLGLFNYTRPEIGPDGTNEIDIEFARWGDAKWPNGNFTVFPALAAALRPSQSQTFEFALKGNRSTHRFDWSARGVEFWSFGARGKPLAHWNYLSPRPLQDIPQTPLPLHLNLWLFKGQPPRDGRAVEIVVRDFSWAPLAK